MQSRSRRKSKHQPLSQTLSLAGLIVGLALFGHQTELSAKLTAVNKCLDCVIKHPRKDRGIPLSSMTQPVQDSFTQYAALKGKPIQKADIAAQNSAPQFDLAGYNRKAITQAIVNEPPESEQVPFGWNVTPTLNGHGLGTYRTLDLDANSDPTASLPPLPFWNTIPGATASLPPAATQTGKQQSTPAQPAAPALNWATSLLAT